ncbi:MAG: type IX secretion system protein PorQ [Lishizhenia sp.]
MKIVVALFCLHVFFIGFSQTGGETVFSFLDLGFNARANALGTDFITVKDKDVNLGVANPSLLNKEMSKSLGVNQALLAGGINYGMLAYAKHFEKAGTFSGHLRYVSYGTMIRRNEAGVEQGSFSAGDFALGAGYGKTLNPKVSVGANFNIIYSQLESFISLGLGLDLAGSILLGNDNRTLFTALIKNVGFQFKGYTKGNREALRSDFQMGISHKLEHAPFRFSVLAHDLNRWDLSYNDPNEEATLDLLTQELIEPEKAGFAEKLGRHFTFQVEALLGDKIHIRTAFDYQRRREMRLESRPGAAGLSFGAGFYFQRFSLDYGISIVSQAGYNNMLTLTTDLSKWKK